MSFELNIKENMPVNLVSFVCINHEHKVVAEVHFWKRVVKVYRPRKRPINESVDMVSLRCPLCKLSEEYEFKGLVSKDNLVVN